MSYTLYYKSCFLRVKDMYLPMFEAADSNLYEFSNPHKRVRDWSNTIFADNDGGIFLTKENALALPLKINEKIRNKEKKYTDNNLFGYYYGVSVKGKRPINTTFNDFKNLFENGVRLSLGYDDLKQLGISIKAYVYCGEGIDFTRKPISINSEKDIVDAVKDNKTVWFSYWGLDNDKYNYIKTVCRYNRGEARNKKNYLVRTNLGYVKGFDGFIPLFTANKSDAALFANTDSKYIINGIMSVGNGITSVGNATA